MEKGSFQKNPFSRDSKEFRESRDSRELPDCGKQSPCCKGEPDLVLELLENLEILEIPPAQRPLFVMTPFSGPDPALFGCFGQEALERHLSVTSLVRASPL